VQLSVVMACSDYICDPLRSFYGRGVFAAKDAPDGGHDRNAMWDQDSYGDLLDEHTNERHTIGSSLILLIVGVLPIVLA